MKLVSIIIPTYNRITYLIEAVESCIVQSYSNIEVLIIDDGSTDATEKTIFQLLQNNWKSYNIRYYKQINSGACAARNYGLSLAKGHYIQFLDSDDLLLADKLKHQINFIKANNLEGCSCYGDMGANQENRNTVETLGLAFNSIQNLLERLCNGVHVMPTLAPVWQKASLLESSGWDEELGFGDDLEYHIRLLLKVQRFQFLDAHLFFVRVHEQERLSDASNNINAILSGIRTQQKITKYLKASRYWNVETRQGIISQCRTLYVNLIGYKDIESIKAFEFWLRREFDLKKYARLFSVLLIIRRIFGRRISSFVLQSTLKVKN